MTDAAAASLATGLPRLRALDMGRSVFCICQGQGDFSVVRWQLTDAGLKLVAKYLPGLVSDEPLIHVVQSSSRRGLDFEAVPS